MEFEVVVFSSFFFLRNFEKNGLDIMNFTVVCLFIVKLADMDAAIF